MRIFILILILLFLCSPTLGQSVVESDGLTSDSHERSISGEESGLRFKESAREKVEGTSLTYIFSVGFLVLMLVAVVYWRQRVFGAIGGGSERIAVRERRRLSVQSYATILSVDGKEYLLAENNHAMTLVQLPDNNN